MIYFDEIEIGTEFRIPNERPEYTYIKTVPFSCGGGSFNCIRFSDSYNQPDFCCDDLGISTNEVKSYIR